MRVRGANRTDATALGPFTLAWLYEKGKINHRNREAPRTKNSK
jgi:hypothetical protein